MCLEHFSILTLVVLQGQRQSLSWWVKDAAGSDRKSLSCPWGGGSAANYAGLWPQEVWHCESLPTNQLSLLRHTPSAQAKSKRIKSIVVGNLLSLYDPTEISYILAIVSAAHTVTRSIKGENKHRPSGPKCSACICITLIL